MEYLLGRSLRNAALNLGVSDALCQALNELGLAEEDIVEFEHDAGLGNGGLGRLAACLLDSCATLNLPVLGYGLRYHYGMFRQHIDNGHQIEEPDPWLRDGHPWEIERPEFSQHIGFGGHIETEPNRSSKQATRWHTQPEVLAIPYDIPIPGYRNSLNLSHPRVLQLVMDSLRYWVTEMHVDGFRFDLASSLAREADGFDSGSAFFDAVRQDPVLNQVKLIAEPWDIGPGGYQLGRFPSGWAEWNDRFRDTTRRFWRGENGLLPELARRLHGSSDLFEHNGRHGNYHSPRTQFADIQWLATHGKPMGESDWHNVQLRCLGMLLASDADDALNNENPCASTLLIIFNAHA